MKLEDVLSFLLAGPVFGLDLMERTGLGARLYSDMRRLEKWGLVRSVERMEPDGKRSRYYELTDYGRERAMEVKP